MTNKCLKLLEKLINYQQIPTVDHQIRELTSLKQFLKVQWKGFQTKLNQLNKRLDNTSEYLLFASQLKYGL